jgi:hypothetical protein
MYWTKLKRIAVPTIPVLTVDDVKRHLNIAHSDEDTLIEVGRVPRGGVGRFP